MKAQLLKKIYKLRLRSKKLVTCPVTSIPDPDGDEAKKTELLGPFWCNGAKGPCACGAKNQTL